MSEMSEMSERVARAIAKASGGDPDKLVYDNDSGMGEIHPWWVWEMAVARAAIEAMREPTGPMLNAGSDRMEQDYLGDGRYAHRPSDSYRAMIDAALND